MAGASRDVLLLGFLDAKVSNKARFERKKNKAQYVFNFFLDKSLVFFHNHMSPRMMVDINVRSIILIY